MSRSSTQKPTGPVHRYEDLVIFLRGQMRTGELAVGDRLPSFVELQSFFGTTPNTVNRALVELEREGLIHREKRRGVFVAAPTRDKRYSIGLFNFQTENSFSPYNSLLIDGAREAASREQYDVILLDGETRRGLEKVDGVIVHGEGGEDFAANLPPGCPVTAIMGPVTGVPSVTVDEFEAGRQAARHLLELGHKHIGFLGYVDDGSPATGRRLAGYEVAMRRERLKIEAEWVRSIRVRPMSELQVSDVRFRAREIGHINMVEWLQDGWREQGITAVIAQSDELAIGIMQALSENGVGVPRDVSVVGFDSTELCEMCSPRLTSVNLPLRKIGGKAVELLLKMIREEPVENEAIMLPTSLDVRQSTAPFAQ